MKEDCRSGLMALAFTVLASVSAHDAAASGCRDIFAKAEQAQTTAALQALYREALLETTCDETFIRGLGKMVATSMVRAVEQREAAGTPLRELERDLGKSLQYARLWSVLATLGDIAQERGDFQTATRRFQEALATIEDIEETPKPPSREVIERIFRKAEATRLLATRYVAPPTNRAGKATGLGADNVRGFVPKKVAVPITFEFDSTAFTEQGNAAARDLMQQLAQRNFPNITLIGHTDPRGSENYNLDLSRRRGEALRDFMLSQGYSGRITIEARGERDPYRPDDLGRYTQEQFYQLNRRVELLR